MVEFVDDEVLVEAAVRALVMHERDPRQLVYDLVVQWPQATALQIMYAISMAAGTVERLLVTPRANGCAQDAWRMAGLIAADLYSMEQMAMPHTMARDLMDYWLLHDRYFLEFRQVAQCQDPLIGLRLPSLSDSMPPC